MSIPNPHFIGRNNAANLRLKRQAVMASLGVGFSLVAIKLYAYSVTDSVSLLSSLLDSGFDVLASLVALAGVIHAATPADADHRYGHGKAEALATFLQAIFIFLSSLFLWFEALQRLRNPTPIEAPMIGIAVTVIAIVLTLGLVAFQKQVIARTQSMTITADSLHYRGDLLMNIGVITALILSAYAGLGLADSAFAAGVGFYLLFGAYKIGRHAIDVLMDRELDNTARANILTIVHSHPAAVAVHDLRSRAAGDRIFIEFHLELDGALTLESAHTVTEEIERLLFAAYPASEVIIHAEPAGLDDHRRDDQLRD